ncbi:GntR family transcriptional regulator [Vreelandella olivaria]|uniref:GntR family transcriptional regulator n=1 Tax=Vreelandella olivaria TaxID=390919 RepID=A0ABM7GUF3_9GAMM|nr:GntR family transcriptional regulator [Halomonas olivaria]
MAVESFSSIRGFADAQRRSSRRSHALFEALQKEIVLGSLQPEQSLTEMDLAQRFDCSQGTVREALMRLNEEGLVNRLPNRGTHVAPCHADDARALLNIRREVECTYLDRVVARANAQLDRDLHEMLNGMRNAARDRDEYMLSVWDRSFHTRLFLAAELPVVTPILTRCLIHNHRFKILNSTPNRELEATAERHVPILDALAARDTEALHDILGHHIATIVDFGPDLTNGDTAG